MREFVQRTHFTESLLLLRSKSSSLLFFSSSRQNLRISACKSGEQTSRICCLLSPPLVKGRDCPVLVREILRGAVDYCGAFARHLVSQDYLCVHVCEDGCWDYARQLCYRNQSNLELSSLSGNPAVDVVALLDLVLGENTRRFFNYNADWWFFIQPPFLLISCSCRTVCLQLCYRSGVRLPRQALRYLQLRFDTFRAP